MAVCFAPTAGCVSTLNVTPVCCFIPDSEGSDHEVTAEGAVEHASPLPLPLHQPPHRMDRLPVQHALLHRLHGPGKGHVCAHAHYLTHLSLHQHLWSF